MRLFIVPFGILAANYYSKTLLLLSCTYTGCCFCFRLRPLVLLWFPFPWRHYYSKVFPATVTRAKTREKKGSDTGMLLIGVHVIERCGFVYHYPMRTSGWSTKWMHEWSKLSMLITLSQTTSQDNLRDKYSFLMWGSR